MVRELFRGIIILDLARVSYAWRNSFNIRALFYAREAEYNNGGCPNKGIIDELAALDSEAAFALHY